MPLAIFCKIVWVDGFLLTKPIFWGMFLSNLHLSVVLLFLVVAFPAADWTALLIHCDELACISLLISTKNDIHGFAGKLTCFAVFYLFTVIQDLVWEWSISHKLETNTSKWEYCNVSLPKSPLMLASLLKLLQLKLGGQLIAPESSIPLIFFRCSKAFTIPMYDFDKVYNI